ncbi:hypothetical protein RSOL_181270 [Rhizoctonia solani AG-3 Rhs1AP]|uniref:DUF6532 domain-containing protein n=1 Tax=Rhizoctonia solani AG-3 Rhs1AP TaxID=1086054 RepID=X8J3E0_9AGAM|nr:hypothetical protein RSOL_181270 [Rhizoctonia solani AG-3 Rhs1AP]
MIQRREQLDASATPGGSGSRHRVPDSVAYAAPVAHGQAAFNNPLPQPPRPRPRQPPLLQPAPPPLQEGRHRHLVPMPESKANISVEMILRDAGLSAVWWREINAIQRSHVAPITTTRPSTRPAGHCSGPYRTRLNITEINLARRLTQTLRTTVGTVHPPQVSTHVNSTSQHHSSQPNPTPNPAPAPRSSSQHWPLRNQSIQAPSLPSQPEPEPQPALQAQADTDLLEDNEEERAILGAMATCTIALRKKRKPAMSDLDGEERHIVLVVRDLVLVYSVVYNDELVPASDEMCAVTINNISTSRGHINEREREVVRRYYDFVDPTNNEQCQSNVNSYAILWPTAFLCNDPSNKTGHFESNVIGAGIAAGYFHTPTALGVKYPKYFKSMDYPLVAFILCSIQCCIGEWEEGYFEKRPLSARYMLSLYVCHLKGLKEAEVKAPGRMAELRAKWYNDSLKASGALRTPKSKKFVQKTIRREDIRPDSPHHYIEEIQLNPGLDPSTEPLHI